MTTKIKLPPVLMKTVPQQKKYQNFPSNSPVMAFSIFQTAKIIFREELI